MLSSVAGAGLAGVADLDGVPFSVRVDDGSGNLVFDAAWLGTDVPAGLADYSCVLGSCPVGTDPLTRGSWSGVRLEATLPGDDVAQTLAHALVAFPACTPAHPRVTFDEAAEASPWRAMAQLGAHVDPDDVDERAEWALDCVTDAIAAAATDSGWVAPDRDANPAGVGDAAIAGLARDVRGRLLAWASYGGTETDAEVRADATSGAARVSRELLEGIGPTASIAYAMGTFDVLWDVAVARHPRLDARG